MKDIKEKAELKTAREELNKQLGVAVGSAYGYPKPTKTVCVPGKSEDPQYFLIVWSNKKVPKMPKEFMGFKVVRRDMPVAGPAIAKLK